MSRYFLSACLLFLLGGCATAPPSAMGQVHDPWENWNRKVFVFNDGIDRYFFKPLAQGYQFVMPEVLNKGVTNIFSNIGELPTSLNATLQGKPKSTGKALLRFLINSTLGVVGIFDIATMMGVEQQKEDFAQTLAVWGVPSGNYLMLPFLGPTTIRGLASLPVAYYTDPLRYTVDNSEAKWGLWTLYLLDARADLLKAEALVQGDRYIFIRDAFMQHRHYLILDGQVPDAFDNQEFDDDDWLEEAE